MKDTEQNFVTLHCHNELDL